MKKIATTCAGLTVNLSATACTTCHKQIQEAIFNSTFIPNLLTMLSAFFVLAAVVGALAWWGARARAKRTTKGGPASVRELNPPLVTTASIILGIGLVGFIGGIVLHKILRWHNMLSAKLPPDTVANKAVNMFWDGIFHLFTLIVTLIGIIRLWRAGQRGDYAKNGWLLSGGMLTGWGLFNVVEGVINHNALNLHNVRAGVADPGIWNSGFLWASFVMIIVGSFFVRRGQEPHLIAGEAAFSEPS